MAETESDAGLSDAISEACSAVVSCCFTVAEKLHLGGLIVSSMMTTSEVQRDYVIAKRTILKYAQSVREGKVLYPSGGRPPLIDAEGMNNVREFVHRHTDIDDLTIKEILLVEYENTYKRRHLMNVDEEVTLPRPRRSTLHRYVCLARQMLADAKCEEEDGLN